MVVKGNSFLFTVQYRYVVTNFFYRGKRSALFCCCGRIQIMYFFSCFLQYNLRGAEMLFEIQKNISNNKANALAFLFQITFLHLGGYSATNTITHALFLKSLLIDDFNIRLRIIKITEDQNFCSFVIKLHSGNFCGIFCCVYTNHSYCQMI